MFIRTTKALSKSQNTCQTTVKGQKYFHNIGISIDHCIFMFTRKFTMLLLADIFLRFWCYLKVK